MSAIDQLTASELEQHLRLQQMKRLPLLLLALMAALYVYSLGKADWWLWLHAFSEAAMVGALADWFAVTALFRHPLGIPIPHTAIIAKRKDEIGASMASFVAENFLQAEVLSARLRNQDLAALLINWLQQSANRQQLVSNTLALGSWAMSMIGEERVRDFAHRLLQRQSAQFDLAKAAGKTLEFLTKNGRHQEILTQTLRFAIVALNDNKERIRSRVQTESPWWMPGFVDDKIVGQLLGRIESLLFEMALDQEHELRQRFDLQLEKLIVELSESEEYRQLGEKIKQDFLENTSLQDYLLQLWSELADKLKAAETDPESKIHKSLDQLLQAVVLELQSDSAMRTLVNQWLNAGIVRVVSENREAVSALISDTVRAWDPATTAQRVELAIGRDLQFIRINGTLVGGLVGISLHALNDLAGKF